MVTARRVPRPFGPWTPAGDSDGLAGWNWATRAIAGAGSASDRVEFLVAADDQEPVVLAYPGVRTDVSLESPVALERDDDAVRGAVLGLLDALTSVRRPVDPIVLIARRFQRSSAVHRIANGIANRRSSGSCGGVIA